MEERYRDGAGFVMYAEDSYEARGSFDRNSTVPSSKIQINGKLNVWLDVKGIQLSVSCRIRTKHSAVSEGMRARVKNGCGCK
ncbi:hypothetical protein DITRI_Ditri09bG0097600 [Diplodiscus trichospermus]